MIYIILVNIVIAVIGAFVGNFLTIARYRIPRKKNLIYENSVCINCHHKLKFLDLIPIFSYIFLRGKCRYCKKKISKGYFLTELFTMIIFLLFYNLAFLRHGMSMYMVYLVVFFPMMYIYMYLIGKINKDLGVVNRGLIEYGLIVATLAIFSKTIMFTTIDYVASAIILVAIILNIITVLLPKTLSSFKEEIRIVIAILILCAMTSIDLILVTLQISMIILIIKAIINKQRGFSIRKLSPIYIISITLIILNVVQYVFWF